MNIIDFIYTGIVILFSIACIVYGICSAITIRNNNIKRYQKDKQNRKEEFNKYEHKN